MSSFNATSDQLRNKRKLYNDKNNTFTEEDLVSKDPLVQFKTWFEKAMDTPEILEPNAVCLATSDRNGMPSARFILLKAFGPEGFTFFTNYNSRKAKDLDENPQAALTVYWQPLNRSIRIEGRVEKISEAESAEYFNSRPRDSQISASVSEQSSIVSSRAYMQDQFENFTKKTDGAAVLKPNHWGGYRVIPDSIEFWQGQSDRFHDRIRFRKLKGDEVIDNTITHMGDDGWVYERLYP